MQPSGPATANFYKPSQLELTFVHSGHVLVRLITRNHRELAATQLQVTDQAGITLPLAQDQYVRDLYVAILKRGQQLYNWSQMLSRLGVSSSFADQT